MNRQRTILVISLLIPMGIDFQTRLTFFSWPRPESSCLLSSRSRDRPKNKATMTDTSALSSTGSLFVANGVMDVPPTVARRPHSQDARRRWRIARSIAWATQMRCLQTPSHLVHSQRRRRRRGRGEPVGADRHGRPSPTPFDHTGSAGGRRNGQEHAYLRRWRPRKNVEICAS